MVVGLPFFGLNNGPSPTFLVEHSFVSAITNFLPWFIIGSNGVYTFLNSTQKSSMPMVFN